MSHDFDQNQLVSDSRQKKFPGGSLMLKGFKQFILRGNVVDMAVGVVVGAAFAAVVGAFTKDLLTRH